MPKNVRKYVGINRFSVIWNIMDITWTMTYAMIKLQVFMHLLANTALHMKHLTRWSPGICMVTNGPVHHKDDYRPCGERTIFTGDNFPSEKYNLWVASWDWPALHMYSCDWVGFVAYTLLMCPKLTQYQTHKHYIAGSLKPQSPSARWVRGISMGGPIALQLRSTPEVRMARGTFM